MSSPALVRHVAAGEPRAGHLPDAGPRLRDRAGPHRHASAWATSSARCWRACWSGSSTSHVAPLVKIVFFDLFLFATGYKVGPQFFRGLKKNALSQVSLTLVLCVTSLVVTVWRAKVMRYDCGTAAGLMAGAFTESTVIGTAGNTIARLGLPEAEKTRLLNNIPVAYAVSYLVGTGFVVWFLSSLAPRLLRVDLKAESRQLEAQMGGGTTPEAPAAVRIPRVGRARLPARRRRGRPQVGRRALLRARARLRAAVAPRRARSSKPRPERCSSAGDVAVGGAPPRAPRRGGAVRRRDRGPRAARLPARRADVVLTNTRSPSARSPSWPRSTAAAWSCSSWFAAARRSRSRRPRVNRGDLLRIAGRERDVERAGKALGYVERPSSETDVVFVGLGILIGGFVGPLTRHGRRPAAQPHRQRRRAHHGARLRLAALRAPDLRPHSRAGALGVRHRRAGRVHRRRRAERRAELRRRAFAPPGPSLLLVGFLVAVTPHVAALLFGRYVLKMNPLILLGACAGAGTVTAALRASRTRREASSRFSATPCPTRSATSSSPRGDPSS